MRYEFVEGSSSKFWDVELKGNTLHLKWGRIGTAGQSQEKKFPSPQKASAAHDKLVAEKVKKGYRADAPEVPAPAAAVKRVARKVSTTTYFFLHVSHHQFTLEDSGHPGQPFKFDGLDNGLEAQRHGVVAHLRRAAGRVPIAVEVRGDAPTESLDAFHVVTEGSFEAPSGQLEVGSPEETWSGSIDVPAGWLRVQVRQAELDTSDYDGSTGADHYRVILWPAPEAKLKVLLSRDVKDDVVFQPKAKWSEVQSQYTHQRDATTRCLAVVEAARHLLAGEKKALALLREGAKDESDAVRAVTLSALGITGKAQRKAVFELLDSRVGDGSSEVRERVPQALSRLGGKEGAAALVALLSNKHDDLAKLAAQLMWTVTEHLEVADVLALLSSKKAGTRLAALNAVKTIGDGHGWDHVGAAVRALLKDKDGAVKELASSLIEKVGAPVGELLAMLKGGTEQRENAAKSLGKSRSPDAYEPLLKLLHKDEDTGVRRSAAEGLGLLGDRRAVPHLAKYLEDGTYNFNWSCARALAALGGKDATQLLWKYATIADADERHEYMGRESINRLVDMLRARAKVKAGEALNPEYDASPDLEDSVVKRSALLGSKDDRLVERGLKLLEFDDDVEAVAAALSRKREETVAQAIRTLRDLLSKPGAEALKERAAKAVAPHLEALSKLAQPRLRTEWLDVLASTGSPLARGAVLAALKDPEAEVRAGAARALGTLGADGALELLAPLLDEKDSNVKHAAAGAFGSFKKDKAAAKKVLTAFLTVAKGSPKTMAQRSLHLLASAAKRAPA